MNCRNCGRELDIYKFARHNRLMCRDCHTLYQIQFPSGSGFLPLALALIPVLYAIMVLETSYLVCFAIYVLFYWCLDIIMNSLLIYFDMYELEVINEK